jgi:hypothetical protein
MQGPAAKSLFAWQPITSRGVSAFAYASWGRLAAVQLFFALLAAGTVVWLLHEAWFPAVLQAIRRLPNQGEIRGGRLRWPADSPASLGENRFLSVAVDLQHSGHARSPAHVQVEFGQADFKMLSLFGFVRWAYPRGYVIGFNRVELEPWWGAWSPVILAGVAGFVMSALMLSWACLATLYFLPVWLLAFFANRDLSLGGSWRLAAAAHMPGALFLTTALFFYGLGVLDPVRLLVAVGLHLVISWIYLLLAPLKLRLHPAVMDAKNPFVPGPPHLDAKPSPDQEPPVRR